VVRFGPFEFDRDSGQLRRGDVRIALQPKPQQLLRILLDNPGAVVTRDELRRHLWGDDTFVDFESGLNTTANRLRLKLNDSAESPLYIETLPRTGYRFIAPVENVEPRTEKSPAVAPEPQPARRWLCVRFLIAFALCAAALFIGILIGTSRGGKPALRFTELTFRRGQVMGARFMPASRSIVYAAQWFPAPRQLYITGESGPESRPLGFEDFTLAAISTTGELAIYASGGTMNIAGSSLYRGSIHGSTRALVDHGIMSADWMSDPRQLVVARAIEGRNRLEYPLGKVVHQTSGWLNWVRHSPHSNAVAFIEHPIRHDDGGRIMLYEPAAGVRAVTEDWSAISGLAWNPLTKEIWFTATRGDGPRSIWAITPGAKPKLVLQAPGTLTLRDIDHNGRVLVTRDTQRLEMTGRLAGESSERAFSLLDWSRVQEVSAGGRDILFEESGDAVNPKSVVYLRHARDSVTTRLAEGIAMGLSPDGESALIASKDHRQLLLVPTKGGTPRSLPDAGVHYQWARFFPDGRRLLILASKPGKGLRMYTRSLSDATLTVISPEMMVRNVAISPDGQQVAILSDKRELTIYPATASALPPRVIATTEPLAPLRWTPDGSHLMVQHLRKYSDSTAQVSRLNVATRRLTPWKTLEPEDRMGVNSITGIAFSPDCESYVYSYRRVLSELFLVEGW